MRTPIHRGGLQPGKSGTLNPMSRMAVALWVTLMAQVLGWPLERSSQYIQGSGAGRLVHFVASALLSRMAAREERGSTL